MAAAVDHTAVAVPSEPKRLQPSTGGAYQAREIDPPTGARSVVVTTEAGICRFARTGTDGSTLAATDYTQIPAAQRVAFSLTDGDAVAQALASFFVASENTSDYVSIEYV